MGYAVYEERNHDRWAGYGVPAVCDWPDCNAEIDRGLAYKCETHPYPEDVADGEWDDEGCGLFFCARHEHETDGHESVSPKPDSVEWMRHMLTDESWEPWRTENPGRVRIMADLVADGGPPYPTASQMEAWRGETVTPRRVTGR